MPTGCDNNLSIQIGFKAALLMSAKLKHINGNDSMCDIVPTAPDVSVRLNTIVRRAHESVVTDNLFAQNIRPSRKEEIQAAKKISRDLTYSGVTFR